MMKKIFILILLFMLVVQTCFSQIDPSNICLFDIIEGNPSTGGTIEITDDPTGTLNTTYDWDESCVDLSSLECEVVTFTYCVEGDCPEPEFVNCDEICTEHEIIKGFTELDCDWTQRQDPVAGSGPWDVFTPGCSATICSDGVNDFWFRLIPNGITSDDDCELTGPYGTIDLSLNGAGIMFNVDQTHSGTYTWICFEGDELCEQSGEFILEIEPCDDCSLMCGSPIVENNICESTDLGIISFCITGGIAPYSWTTVDGTITSSNFCEELFVDASSGTYFVTVTDANDCEVICEAEIISEDNEDFLCEVETEPDNCAQSTGEATANQTGGTAPFSYQWDNGGTTETITGLSEGVYCVTIVDNFGCEVSCCESVINVESNLICDITETNESCAGNDGTLSVNTLNGPAPFLYNWSNGQNTNPISGLTAGIYSLTVTDADGCSAVCEGEVVYECVCDLEIISLFPEDFCPGEEGSIQVFYSGGTAPYSIIWSNGETTNPITVNTAGSYSVTVTDTNDCESIGVGNVNEYPAPTCSVVTTETECTSPTGTVEVNVVGGTPSYSYLWSDGSTSSSVTGLSAGIYSVTVTDSNGCVTECEGEVEEFEANDGNCRTRIQGGQWENTCFINFCPNDGLITFLDVQPGGNTNNCFIVSPSTITYNANNGINGLFVIDDSIEEEGAWVSTCEDSNGCTYNITFFLTEDCPCNLVPVCSAEDETCTDYDDGIIEVTPTGANYVWSDGQTTNPAIGLEPGTYFVTVTDSNGCSGTCEGEVEEATLGGIVLNGDCSSLTWFWSPYPGGSGAYFTQWFLDGVFISNGDPITPIGTGTYTAIVSYSGTGNNCDYTGPGLFLDCTAGCTDPVVSISGGCTILTSSISGACPSPTYQWFLNGAAISGATSSTYSPPPNISGFINLQVLCSNGCDDTSNSISLNCGCTDPVVSISGGCTMLTSSISGACPGASYQWFLNGSAVSGATSSTWTPPAGTSGNVLLDVNCSNGCGDSSNGISLNCGCTDPVVNISGSCASGLSSSISGSCPSPSYNWIFNGNTISTSSSVTSSIVQANGNGTYLLLVTCSNGCGDNSSIFISDCVDPCESCSITVSTNSCELIYSIVGAGCAGRPWQIQFQDGCSGSFATVSTGNGTGNGSYTIDEDGCYRIFMPASGNCPAEFSNIASFSGCEVSCDCDVVLIDDGDCTLSAIVSGSASDCANYDLIIVKFNSSGCSGSTCTLEFFPGAAPGTYFANDIEKNACSSYDNDTGYRATLIGNNGCSTNQGNCINLTGCECDISLSVSVSNCVATATPIGGIGPFTYDWEFGLTNTSSNAQAYNVDGNYSVTVTDNLGCTAVQSFVISGCECLSGNVDCDIDIITLNNSNCTVDVEISGADCLGSGVTYELRQYDNPIGCFGGTLQIIEAGPVTSTSFTLNIDSGFRYSVRLYDCNGNTVSTSICLPTSNC